MRNKQFSNAILYRQLANRHQTINAGSLVKYLFENLAKECFDDDIVDLGCGTADIIAELEKYLLPPIKYIGVDSSEPMLAVARKHFKNYQFILADIVKYTQYLPKQTKQNFISNACLHWLDKDLLQELFQNVFAALIDKGHFSFRMSLYKNGKNIKDEIKRTVKKINAGIKIDFAVSYCDEDIEKSLEKSGFNIQYKKEILREKFMPVDTIVTWVKTTQSISFANSKQQDEFYTTLMAHLSKSQPYFYEHHGIFICKKIYSLHRKPNLTNIFTKSIK